MKKGLEAKQILFLQKGIRTIRLKSHCKLSRKDHSILDELNVFLEQSRITRSKREKRLKRFFKVLKFIAKFFGKLANIKAIYL